MHEQTTSNNHTILCVECKNDTKTRNDLKVGDVVECEHCGIEYEVMETDKNDESVLQLIEEEK